MVTNVLGGGGDDGGCVCVLYLHANCIRCALCSDIIACSMLTQTSLEKHLNFVHPLVGCTHNRTSLQPCVVHVRCDEDKVIEMTWSKTKISLGHFCTTTAHTTHRSIDLASLHCKCELDDTFECIENIGLNLYLHWSDRVPHATLRHTSLNLFFCTKTQNYKMNFTLFAHLVGVHCTSTCMRASKYSLRMLCEIPCIRSGKNVFHLNECK